MSVLNMTHKELKFQTHYSDPVTYFEKEQPVATDGL